MSEALDATAPALGSAELARFILTLEVGALPRAKALKRLERLEDGAWEALSDAECCFNVYRIRGGPRPPEMDAARAKVAHLSRATLEAVRAVRSKLFGSGQAHRA